MVATIDMKEIQGDTDQANSQVQKSVSIADAGKRLMRSPSWVKTAKNDLKDIWYWCLNDLFTEDGSFTEEGFDKLQDLFKRTGSSEIVIKRGKTASVPKKPEMSREEYKNSVWNKHRRFPVDEALKAMEDMVSDQDTDQVSDIEVYEAEFVQEDRGSEMAESFSMIKSQASNSIQEKRIATFGKLKNLRGYVKQFVKTELVGGAMEAVDEAFDEIGELMTGQMPEEVQAPKVKKTTRKKTL